MDTKLLKQKILDLAIHGKLVPQNLEHESASELLKRIRGESLPLSPDGKPSSATPSAGSNAARNARSNPISDDEIPFEIPENWCWTRIKDISSEILYGVSESAKATGKYKLLRITDIQNDSVNWDSVPFTDFPEDKVEKYLLKNNDILFARTGGTVGKSYLVENINGNVIYASYLIRIRMSHLLNPKYIKYFFGSITYWNQITINSSGIGQPNVNGTSLGNLIIPLPPLEEQKLIVEEIERIFALIDTVEQNKTDLETVIKQTKSKILDLAIHGKLVPQDKADEPASKMLKKLRTEKASRHPELVSGSKLKRDKNDSYIYRADDGKWYERKSDCTEEEIEVPFEIPENWCWCKLKEIANIARGGSPRPIEDFITEDENGINWIKIGDTKEGDKYITSVREKIKPKGIKHSRFVHSGDFLLTNSMSFGRPYILKVDGCIHDGWLVFADIGKVVDSDFLYYSLSSDFIYTAFSFVAAGSTVKNLKSDTVKETLFPLPPLEEQNRIVNKIEEILKIIDFF